MVLELSCAVDTGIPIDRIQYAIVPTIELSQSILLKHVDKNFT